MAREPTSPRLSAEQRQTILAILSGGCDRETAAKYARCSLGDIRRMMMHSPTFAADVRRAEAGSELAHVRNVQQAAHEGKQWRASVWWLERRSPERFGRRDAGTVTTRQLESFVAQLVSAVMEEIHDAADRERLVLRLDQAAKSLQELCRGDEISPPGSTADENPQAPEETGSEDLETSAGSELDSDDDFMT